MRDNKPGVKIAIRVEPVRKFTCAGCDDVFDQTALGGMCPRCGKLFCSTCWNSKIYREHEQDC